MKIEVFSDVVCPWCYVGLARLEQALVARPNVQAEVRWLPFELNPGMPAEGRDRREYLRERFGTENPFGDAQIRLAQMGREAGIDFQFDRVERAPNTRRAHMLIAWAADSGRQHELKRALLRAHFTDGRDVGDPTVLADVAANQGFDRAAALQALDDPELRAQVEQLEAIGRSWNISGVPTFVLERRMAFSGAQPVEVFHRAFDQLRADPA